MNRCGICKTELDDPTDLASLNCGGDCMRCMAEAGDPDCVIFMRKHALPFNDDGREVESSEDVLAQYQRLKPNPD